MHRNLRFNAENFSKGEQKDDLGTDHFAAFLNR
jgi:hypothetical protein